MPKKNHNKPVYKIATSVRNRNSKDYVPIQVINVRLASDRNKRNPYTHATIEINLKFGTIYVKTHRTVGLQISPYSAHSLCIQAP